ncbi:MAG: trypsin-like peptidase domain-containing protein [Sumerlaeia bacterium]
MFASSLRTAVLIAALPVAVVAQSGNRVSSSASTTGELVQTATSTPTPTPTPTVTPTATAGPTPATETPAPTATPPGRRMPLESPVRPTPEATPEPSRPATPAAETPVPSLPEGAEEARYYWSLKGGGEVIGRLIKDTPEQIFIDVGPDILAIPRGAVERRLTLADLLSGPAQERSALAGVTEGREGSGSLLSQQEMVEDVKKGVVLIANPRGRGSGFVLDDEGRIVTNYHVVRGEKYHTVTIFQLRNGQWERERFENVELEAYSTLYDIALLRLDMDEVGERGVTLNVVPVAQPGALRVGDAVYAVGNPGMGAMMLESTVTEGIVSSLDRNFNDVIYIQTTAPVNPGNSGGPLIDSDGSVVGLVTLKAIFQEGIAFALPVELLRHFLANSNSYAYSQQAQNDGFRYHRPE